MINIALDNDKHPLADEVKCQYLLPDRVLLQIATDRWTYAEFLAYLTTQGADDVVLGALHVGRGNAAVRFSTISRLYLGGLEDPQLKAMFHAVDRAWLRSQLRRFIARVACSVLADQVTITTAVIRLNEGSPAGDH